MKCPKCKKKMSVKMKRNDKGNIISVEKYCHECKGRPHHKFKTQKPDNLKDYKDLNDSSKEKE